MQRVSELFEQELFEQMTEPGNMDNQTFQFIATISTNAGFAGVVWYLIVKAIPNMFKRLQDDHKDVVNKFTEVVETIREESKEERKAERESLESLRNDFKTELSEERRRCDSELREMRADMRVVWEATMKVSSSQSQAAGEG